MGELMIRRNRGVPVARYQTANKVEKQAGGVQEVSKTAGAIPSETLKQVLAGAGWAAGGARESRQILQMGEGVLAEVQKNLDRMAALAEESAGSGKADRAALQAELERLAKEIDRMLGSALAGDVKLFLDEDGDIGTLPDAVMSEGTVKPEVFQALPEWLLKGIVQGRPDEDRLLAALGLDKNAGKAELLAAVVNQSLDDHPTVGHLAALYLGAVIAGGGEDMDPWEAAKEGLLQLLERVADGVPLDQAIEELTGGAFTSLEDFQEQFVTGAAPGLEDFLASLLLSGGEDSSMAAGSIWDRFACAEGMGLDLMMGLLDALQSAGISPANPEEAALDTGMAEKAAGAGETGADPARAAVLQFGDIQVMGKDLSGVSFQEKTGELTVSGTADVVVQGTGEGEQTIVLAGSGKVTLRNVNASALAVHTAAARVFSEGENIFGEIRLQKGVSLSISGGGRLHAGEVLGGRTNTLRLSGGAAVVVGRDSRVPGVLTVPVVLDGPASLAAQASRVSNPEGKALTPFDVIWKSMLPGWNHVTAVTVDGGQARMSLAGGKYPDPIRLWLERDDLSRGYPAHRVILQGRDGSGRPRTRYAYLYWNRGAGLFEELPMYPNPFTVTGGEPGQDWVYEEGTHTLRVLSAQVTAISGGAGMAADQAPFSGRIALADGIGEMKMALDGVDCRVENGRAFSLGRGNDVTLLLSGGTDNRFESGAGCAGISVGDGTSLCIDCAGASGGGVPVGAVTAVGNGGAGIGRDSGGSRDRSSQIRIRGGAITATGNGGGAGIGAGKRAGMGEITILGGRISSTGGKGGGAGIGGALGAPVGDISIHGGRISAVAAHHAAAIGAGVQGACGNILITGTARIEKALGGDPGVDIGACLSGGCGEVVISGGADIGNARPWTRTGISLQMGEDTVTLPQFRLSSRALQLNRMCVSTREYAQASRVTLDANRRWVSQIQEVYHVLYDRLEQGGSARRAVKEEAVRDSDTAGALLRGLPGQSSQAAFTHGGRETGDVRHLLR